MAVVEAPPPATPGGHSRAGPGNGSSPPATPSGDTATGEVDPGRTRRRWLLVARLAASIGILALIIIGVPEFNWSALVPEWTRTNTLWLVAAAVATLASFGFATLRWRAVLTGMDTARVGLGRLTGHVVAGQFVSNALPTTIGGDVVRVARLSQDTDNSAEAFASVIIDRLTGWLVLPLITFVGFLADPPLRSLGTATVVAAVLAVVTLVALVAILVAAEHPRLLGRFASRSDWRRFAGAVHLGVYRLRRHPAAIAGVVAAGAAYQGTMVLAATAAAFALGIEDAGLTVLAAFLPAVLISQLLPVSIAGLGVREGAFVLFLTPLGVPAEQAVALGLTLYALNLVTSLVGAPAFAMGSSRRSLV